MAVAFFVMLALYLNQKNSSSCAARMFDSSAPAADKKKQKKPPTQQQQQYGASKNKSANDGKFPDDIDNVIWTSTSPPMGGGGGNSDGAAAADNSADKMMDVSKLMPSSWRAGETAGCGPGEREDDTEWTRYAPSKESFEKYVTASGSARLSLNSRSPMARQVGLPNLLRPGVAVPLGGFQSEFLDTDLRQSLIYDATGSYPQSISC